MAIAHLSISTLSRSDGRSSVQMSAYIRGEKQKDLRLSKTFNHSKKHNEILFKEMRGFDGKSVELWNSAEAAEKRKDSVVARHCDIALPKEITLEQNILAMQELTKFIRERYEVATDFAIHAPDSNNQNIHAHILWTTRKVENNFFGEKTKVLDNFKSTGAIEIERIRAEWQRIANDFLERASINQKIDMRSYRRQGIDKVASIHLGATDAAAERAGVKTERGDKNREAQKYNSNNAAAKNKTRAERDAVWDEFTRLRDEKRAAEKEARAIEAKERKAKDETKKLQDAAARYREQRHEIAKAWKAEHKLKSLLKSDGFKLDEKWKKVAYSERKVLKKALENEASLQALVAQSKLDAAKRRQTAQIADDAIAKLVTANPHLKKYTQNKYEIKNKSAELADALKRAPEARQGPPAARGLKAAALIAQVQQQRPQNAFRPK